MYVQKVRVSATTKIYYHLTDKKILTYTIKKNSVSFYSIFFQMVQRAFPCISKTAELVFMQQTPWCVFSAHRNDCMRQRARNLCIHFSDKRRLTTFWKILRGGENIPVMPCRPKTGTALGPLKSLQAPTVKLIAGHSFTITGWKKMDLSTVTKKKK